MSDRVFQHDPFRRLLLQDHMPYLSGRPLVWKPRSQQCRSTLALTLMRTSHMSGWDCQPDILGFYFFFYGLCILKVLPCPLMSTNIFKFKIKKKQGRVPSESCMFWILNNPSNMVDFGWQHLRDASADEAPASAEGNDVSTTNSSSRCVAWLWWNDNVHEKSTVVGSKCFCSCFWPRFLPSLSLQGSGMHHYCLENLALKYGI